MIFFQAKRVEFSAFLEEKTALDNMMKNQCHLRKNCSMGLEFIQIINLRL